MTIFICPQLHAGLQTLGLVKTLSYSELISGSEKNLNSFFVLKNKHKRLPEKQRGTFPPTPEKRDSAEYSANAL